MPTKYPLEFNLGGCINDFENIVYEVSATQFPNEAPKIIFKSSSKFNPDNIEKVIFNNPATIVLFKNGTKEVVKCNEEDMGVFDPEIGFAMCMMNQMFGSRSAFKKFIKQFYNDEEV